MQAIWGLTWMVAHASGATVDIPKRKHALLNQGGTSVAAAQTYAGPAVAKICKCPASQAAIVPTPSSNHSPNCVSCF